MASLWKLRSNIGMHHGLASFAIAFTLLIAISTLARAHELRPIIATLAFPEPGRYELTLDLNLEALIADVGGDHENTADSPNAADYDALTVLAPDALRVAFEAERARVLAGFRLLFDGEQSTPDAEALSIPEVIDPEAGRLTQLVLTGPAPTEGPVATWQMDERYGDSVFRVTDRTGAVAYAGFVTAGSASEAVATLDMQPRGFFTVLTEFIAVGFEHIVPLGLDHIVFVLGLYFLSRNLAPLLVQVTAFTVAHSITLAMAMTGLVTVPGEIVEPLIAASIVFIAVENVLSEKLSRVRPFVVFGFGLLHGLGFAGALTDFGLAEGDFWPGLIGFNIGVELGQLAVIAAAFLVVGWWFGDKPWYRARIAVPASLIIGAFGAYWFVERVFL